MLVQIFRSNVKQIHGAYHEDNVKCLLRISRFPAFLSLSICDFVILEKILSIDTATQNWIVIKRRTTIA